jgi:hypothetical protein
MSRFRNLSTGVVVSVSSEKDDRFADGWESAEEAKRTPGRTSKSASK